MENQSTADFRDADANRLAIEIVSTLVNIKRSTADQILRVVGVPEELVRRFLTDIDQTSSKPITKRQGATLILDELGKQDGGQRKFVRDLIALAADWNSFHLASDEYKARAVVQKARAMTGILAERDNREKETLEKIAAEHNLQKRRAKESELRNKSSLLLSQFDHVASDADPHERGFILQELLASVFTLHGIPIVRSFQRNSGGEQIDAAFELEGWHYIVECRWRKKLADIRELDGLMGQISRSGKQTMGLLLSINGWSENVVPLLKQNREKSIVLMEGYDLRTVLALPMDLRSVLKAKISALNLESEPFISVKDFRS